MKNWKTTLSGLAAAIIVAVQGVHGHSLPQVGLAIAVAAVGYFAADAKASA